MTFDAVMFLTEVGRFITFNCAFKVNLIFNFRPKKKYTILIFFFSEIIEDLLSQEPLNTLYSMVEINN